MQRTQWPIPFQIVFATAAFSSALSPIIANGMLLAAFSACIRLQTRPIGSWHITMVARVPSDMMTWNTLRTKRKTNKSSLTMLNANLALVFFIVFVPTSYILSQPSIFPHARVYDMRYFLGTGTFVVTNKSKGD